MNIWVEIKSIMGVWPMFLKAKHGRDACYGDYPNRARESNRGSTSRLVNLTIFSLAQPCDKCDLILLCIQSQDLVHFVALRKTISSGLKIYCISK
jgi:hypothetical protein